MTMANEDAGTVWDGLLGSVVYVRAGDFQYTGRLVRVWGDRAGIDWAQLEDVLRIYMDAEKRPDPGEDRFIARTRIGSTQVQEAHTAVDQWGSEAWYHDDIRQRRQEWGIKDALSGSKP